MDPLLIGSFKTKFKSAFRNFNLAILVGATPFALCSFADAQQTKKIFRLGVLAPSSPPAPEVPAAPNLVPKFLRELGYIESQNLLLNVVSRTANLIAFLAWPKSWSTCTWM